VARSHHRASGNRVAPGFRWRSRLQPSYNALTLGLREATWAWTKIAQGSLADYADL
ncbi:hypothetical protein BAV1807, partial [Bordetella avium 197N]